MLWITVCASSASSRPTATAMTTVVASSTVTEPLTVSTMVSVACLMRNGDAMESSTVTVAARMTIT